MQLVLKRKNASRLRRLFLFSSSAFIRLPFLPFSSASVMINQTAAPPDISIALPSYANDHHQLAAAAATASIMHAWEIVTCASIGSKPHLPPGINYPGLIHLPMEERDAQVISPVFAEPGGRGRGRGAAARGGGRRGRARGRA